MFVVKDDATLMDRYWIRIIGMGVNLRIKSGSAPAPYKSAVPRQHLQIVSHLMASITEHKGVFEPVSQGR